MKRKDNSWYYVAAGAIGTAIVRSLLSRSPDTTTGVSPISPLPTPTPTSITRTCDPGEYESAIGEAFDSLTATLEITLEP